MKEGEQAGNGAVSTKGLTLGDGGPSPPHPITSSHHHPLTLSPPHPLIPSVLLVQRPLHGLWGGLWEFPRVVCERGEDARVAAVRAAREAAGLEVAVSDSVGVVKHSVTHHRITLHGFLSTPALLGEEPRPLICAAVRWVPLDALDGYALSAPQALLREALKQYLAGGLSAGLQRSLDL